jgi:hypothetical protein
MPTMSRETLRHLVDEVPDSEIERVTLVVRALVDAAVPHRPLDQAPYDDEPDDDDADGGLTEARAEAARGELIPLEDVERELGLL